MNLTTEIELADGVWDKAMAAREAVRYVDHPANRYAAYGMSSYAIRAMLDAAFAAGRESAYTRDEWRVCGGPANKQLPEEFQFPYICADEIETAEEAALELSRARVTWANEDSWIEYRRTGATDWQRVDQVGERQQSEAVADGR